MENKNVQFGLNYLSTLLSSMKDLLSLRRYEGPFIDIILEWCKSLSKTALARVDEPKNSPHLENGIFVVTIVVFFSYLLSLCKKVCKIVSPSMVKLS